jgi:hypothetical protein
MGPSRVIETEVYASHHQFYVVDDAVAYRTDLVWDGAGLERHLGVSDGIVAVGTVAYATVPLTLELWDEAPPREVDAWDHVVEASLAVDSGSIAVHGVEGPGELDAIGVAPGTYRVRAPAAALAEAEELDGGDRYRVQLWPAAPAEPEW